MKAIQTVLCAVLTLGAFQQAYSTDADQLARDVIAKYKMPPWYVSSVGHSEEEKQTHKARIDASKHLRAVMLDPKTPESLRISYALHLLAFSKTNTFSIHEHREFTEKESILAKRFAELPN